MTPIALKEWGKYTGREPLCTLPLSVNDLATQTGLRLARFDGAGRVPCYCGFARSGEFKYFFQGFRDRDCRQPPVSVDMEGSNVDPHQALRTLLQQLQLAPAALPWRRADLDLPRWQLYRRDNFGQEFPIARYFTEAAATWVGVQLGQVVRQREYGVRRLCQPSK